MIAEKELRQDILENGGHFLCAGTTGSGKSTFLHSLMCSALECSPTEWQFSFIDLKGGVELARYEKLPHTIGLADDIVNAKGILDHNIAIMERRLKELRRDNLTLYKGNTCFIVIDELADLIALGGTPIIDKLTHIMRLGRATKVRTLLFTQSPNRSKGGGLPAIVQQNVCSALALRCRSSIESRQIIGIGGAEKLARYGKGLYWNYDGIKEVDVPKEEDWKMQHRIDFWKNKNYNFKVVNATN